MQMMIAEVKGFDSSQRENAKLYTTDMTDCAFRTDPLSSFVLHWSVQQASVSSLETISQPHNLILSTVSQCLEVCE